MPLKTSQMEELPSVNLTSMIDVVFLLIIFFMVATNFTETQQQIGIKLAGAGQLNPMATPPSARVVSIAKDGKLYLDGAAVTNEDLTSRLKGMRVQYPSLSVLIESDGASMFDRVAAAMGAVNRAGVSDLSIRVSSQPQMLR
ncbi:MAG: biopolymer transporter ExbD [Pirellulales bacterium]